MKYVWKIEAADRKKVQKFLSLYEDDYFVKQRIRWNLRKKKAKIGKAEFWQQMIACLLTTQQRSGPHSAVNRFLTVQPFPLSLEKCLTARNLESHTQKMLTKSGGLRRTRKIAGEVANNLQLLEEGLWDTTMQMLENLRLQQDRSVEREVATFIDDSFGGFGPKQSRNLIQCLGLSRYEIPLDSRITKWLNDFGFPVHLSAGGLADPDYYNFVIDGIQSLCEACNVFPCVLDAAIFASYDNGEWNEENLV